MIMQKSSLTEKNGRMLLQLLTKLSCLISLTLTGAGLTLLEKDADGGEFEDAAARSAIVNLLASSKCRIKYLNLSRNKLGLESALQLCQALILN